jgi:hypothetical protein
MSFIHKVDKNLDIVVLKAKGKVTVMDILSEIRQAIDTKRGQGLTRRLIDMTAQDFSYTHEDAQKVLKIMKVHSQQLGSRRMAVLLKTIPDDPEFEQIKSIMSSSNLEFRFFTDKAKAVQFLNKPVRKKG